MDELKAADSYFEMWIIGRLRTFVLKCGLFEKGCKELFQNMGIAASGCSNWLQRVVLKCAL